MTAQQDVEGPRSPSPQLRDVTPVPDALTVDTRQAKHVVAEGQESSVKKQKPARIGAGFKPTLPPVAPSEAPEAAPVPPRTSTNETNDQPHTPSSLYSTHAGQTVTTRNDLREPLSVFSRQRSLTSTALLEPSEDSSWTLRPIDLSDFVVYSCIAEKPAERPFLHRSEKRIPLVNPASLTIDKAKDSLLKEFELAQWERHEMQVRTANYDALKDEIVRLEGELRLSSRKNQQLQKELGDADVKMKLQEDLVEASVQLRATLKDDLEAKDSLLKAEKTKTTELSTELEGQRAAYKELEKKLKHHTKASWAEVGIQTELVDDDDVQEIHYEVPRNVTTELNNLRGNLATVTSERDRLSKKLEEQKTEHEGELGTAHKAIADLQKQLHDKGAELRVGLSSSAVLKQKLSEGQRNVGALTKVLKSRGLMLRRRVCLRCAPKRQRKKKSDRIEVAQQEQMLVTLDHIINQVRSQNAPQATLSDSAPESSDVQHMVAAVQHGHRQVMGLLDAASGASAPSSIGSADVAPSTIGIVTDRAARSEVELASALGYDRFNVFRAHACDNVSSS
ncbi:hypothetical protein AAVH_12728 [Aphelenchoides avenae]|nr:hypothetical protein AAVH_12728 [Aphelenchus avenae]